MLKFVVDESTGRQVADFLQEEGYDTVFVGEEMYSATDEEIMNFALDETRIIVTNDKDFGRKVVKGNKGEEGILLLRLKIETPDNKIKATKNVIENHIEKIGGNLMVAREDKIKVRKIS